MTTEYRYDRLLVYGGGMLFIIANALLMYRGFYWLSLLPLVLAVFYYAFFSLGKLFMAVVFLTPLSVELSRFTGPTGYDLSLPTEPLIMVILLVVILRLAHRGSVDRQLLIHPVSLALIFYLLWMFITAITSTMPMVSMKFFLVRLWFTVVFYFLATAVFRRHGNIRVFLWCYMTALLIVAAWSLYNHSAYGFIAQRAAHWVVRPFYNDHTVYGAALAMFIPVIAAFTVRRRSGSPYLFAKPCSAHSKGLLPSAHACRWLAPALLAVFVIALVFSYSRAAWLSLAAAALVWFVIRMRIPFSVLMTFSLLLALMIFMLRGDIVREMGKNTQDSSADFREHLRSVTNITSDASNLERINRWKAAVAMAGEKPLFGWGPGTYMFQYAPFQYSYDRTIISTNFADGGDAHSEYLGPLAESGFPGMISFMAVALLGLVTGFRLLHSLKKRKDRILVTGVLLGLITYLVHGGLNNFLHSDKSAVPFWGFLAILVAVDLYRSKRDDPWQSAPRPPHRQK